MKLAIFTICLDAMPFITWHLPVFNRLKLDWRWIVAEGAALNIKDTSWCKPQGPRLSTDGTTEYLSSLRHHPRVKLLRKQLWQGKVEMCQACANEIKEPCVLLEVDADEIWDARSIEWLVKWFETNPDYNCGRFDCVYYVGQNIITTTPNAYGHNPEEWLRAWRFEPGMKWRSHEPPFLEGVNGKGELCFKIGDTSKAGMIFHHYAYAFAAQVAYKQSFYGYPNALQYWQHLQHNTKWPVRLVDWLPWSDDRAMAELLHK